MHVLGTPPALILSQDQTLMLKWPPFDSSRTARARDPEFASGTTRLTRGLMNWLCVVQSVLKFVVNRQPPSHGLTTPDGVSTQGLSPGSTRRSHALTLIVRLPSPACAAELRRDRVCVCACTHYLVFKEPTDQSSKERLEAFRGSPTLSYPPLARPQPHQRCR